MGEKVKHLRTQPQAGAKRGMKTDITLQRERADMVLPILAQILGVNVDGN